MPELREKAEKTPVTTRTALLLASTFICAFLIGRVRIGDGIWPFGTALIFTAFMNQSKINPYITLAGVLSALCTHVYIMDYIGFSFAIVSLSAATMMVLTFFKVRLTRRITLICALVIYTVCTLCFKLGMLYPMLSSVIELILCALVTVIFDITVKLLFGRGRAKRVFSDEEIICISMTAMLAVMGLSEINIFGVYLSNIAAVYISITAAYLGGAALGGAAGAMLGFAAMLGGADSSYAAVLAIASVSGGALKTLNKAGVACGYFIISLILHLFIGADYIWIPAAETAIGICGFIATPKNFMTYIGKYVDSNLLRDSEQQLHLARFREITLGKLKDISDVLHDAGDVFRASAEKPAGENGVLYMVSPIPDEACADCVFLNVCWDKEYERTSKMLAKLYKKYERCSQITERDMGSSFLKHCVRPGRVLAAAENVFYRYSTNLHWQSKVMESRAVVGEQLLGVSRVIDSLKSEISIDLKFSADAEASLRRRLDRAGIDVREVCIEEYGGSTSVTLKIRSCGGNGICKNKIPEIVSRECAKPMALCSDSNICMSGKYCTLRFCEARSFTVCTGVASAGREYVSGDAHSFGMLPDGRYMQLLCDGMGCGEEAAKESGSAVALVENFYRAGFDDEVIMKTINKLLILSGSEEMFSTMDLCLADLKTGNARIIKIGAPHSYIFSAESVKKIHSGSLPLGILDEFRPSVLDTRLSDGDVLVMFTDGIADIELIDDTFFDAVRRAVQVGNVQDTANIILAEAAARMQGKNADDMTVMVTAVRARPKAFKTAS